MPTSPRFLEAVSYAAALHGNQERKFAGGPYLAHLLAVAATVMEHGGNEDEAIAALLHDAVEDQGGLATLAEIRRRFGDTVARIVDGCTDTAESPKPPWRPRKEAYLARLQQASPSVRLVSAADKLHNIRSILREYRRHGESIWGLFRGGREGTLWYYRSVVDSLKQRGGNALVEDLERAVMELEQLVRQPRPHRGEPRESSS
jgi:(p)ppGpp synthase/HD superfamily hydrolase